MPVTITNTALAAAIRLGTTTEELAEVTRLLTYATTAIERHLGAAYASTPDTVVDEAAVRIVGYLFDIPTVSRGDAFSNVVRNSGAGRMLLPYVVHRAGSTVEAQVAAIATGVPGNPVVDVQITGDELIVSYADGSSQAHTLPAGGMGGSGVDQTARDAAAAAQRTANANASKLMPPNTAEAAAGTSTTIRGWTAALIRTLVEAGGPSGGGLPTVSVESVNMIGGTFGTSGAGRTLKVPYPSGLSRSSFQGRVVDCHVFAAVTSHFPQGSRVLTLSSDSLWLSEGAVGSQWNVLLADDGIRLYVPFAVVETAITAATAYLARMT